MASDGRKHVALRRPIARLAERVVDESDAYDTVGDLVNDIVRRHCAGILETKAARSTTAIDGDPEQAPAHC